MTTQPTPAQSDPAQTTRAQPAHVQPNPYAAVSPAGWHVEPGSNRYRWWDGSSWGVYHDQMPAGYVGPVARVAVVPSSATNGFAVAALVLGIWGFLVTWIPFLIGLVLGGLPDLLAVVFGILGIVRANASGGRGFVMALIGLILGGLAFLSLFVGAGTLW